jgi:hypothetical protein
VNIFKLLNDKIMIRLTISAIILFAFTQAHGQKPAVIMENKEGWQKIGETEASFKKQDESIHLFGKDRFSSIKLKVTDGSLNVDRMQVFYEDGQMEEFDVRNQIEDGNESKAFSLKNPNQEISKVAFTYNTSANDQGTRANVIVLGKMTNTEETNTYRDEARETSREINRAADETEEDVDSAVNNAEREVEQQSKETEREIDRAVENTIDDLDSAANRVGNEISQGTSKAAAEIADRRHETKVGPNNQTIYIEDNQRYYYVDRQGQKVYVSKNILKNKKDNR